MKVTDDEILAAIWRQMVSNTAGGVVDNYISGKKGIRRLVDSHDFYYAQNVHVMARENWGIPLSYGHLRRRAVAAIKASDLPWWPRGEFSSVWLNNARAREVAGAAAAYWTSLGVPTGWDEDNKCMRTAHVDDFGAHVEKLRDILLDRFGNWQDAKNSAQTV